MGWPFAPLLLTAVVAALCCSGQAARKQGQGQRQSSAKARSHLVGRLLNMDMCRDRPSAIANQTTQVHQLADGSVGVDTDFTVTKTAQSFSKLDLILIKCREAVSSNSCEYYHTWSYSLGVCDVIAAPMMPWSSSVSRMRPSFGCPFTKGRYKAFNATANIEAVTHVPIPWEGNVWRITLHLFNELRELHLCWNADMVFVRVKNGHAPGAPGATGGATKAAT